MKVNNQNKLNTIISLLDYHIINELKKKELNEDRVDVLTTIRSEFITEMNSVQRGENIRKMFDKKYFKIYQKSHHY
jgi:hypothetical protein